MSGQPGGAGSGVVVVGGSLAGVHVAEVLRAEGYGSRITVVDADPEPHYDRPPMSKEYLRGTRGADGIMIRRAGQLADLGADWRLGTAASSLDTAARQVVMSDGTAVAYRHLVIATGVQPVLPAVLRVPGVLTLRTRGDADRLRARLARGTRLVVIGAGFLGLEVAAAFAVHGATVHVVESDETPLHRHLGPEVGRAVQRLHEGHGVTFHVATRAVAVAVRGTVTEVGLSSGDTLAADVVLAAVGSAPATGWLADSGLVLQDGVLCDDTLRAASGVFAAGDVVRWPHPLAGRPVRIEHWTNAVEQAAYVGRALARPTGTTASFATVPYFWSDQYDSRIQAFGFPSADDDIEVVSSDLGAERFAVHYRRAGRLTAVVGLNQPQQVRAGRRELAGQLAAQRVLT